MSILLLSDAWLQAGSCSFCNRGVPNQAETGLIFPYSHVALLESTLARGTGSMRLCPQCLADLQQQLDSFAFPEPTPEQAASIDEANTPVKGSGEKKGRKK